MPFILKFYPLPFERVSLGLFGSIDLSICSHHVLWCFNYYSFVISQCVLISGKAGPASTTHYSSSKNTFSSSSCLFNSRGYYLFQNPLLSPPPSNTQANINKQTKFKKQIPTLLVFGGNIILNLYINIRGVFIFFEEE